MSANDNAPLSPLQQIYVELAKEMTTLADKLTKVMGLVTELIKEVEDGDEI